MIKNFLSLVEREEKNACGLRDLILHSTQWCHAVDCCLFLFSMTTIFIFVLRQE